MNSVRKVLKSEYTSRFPDGGRLGKVAKLVDWEAFRPALEPLFKNTGEVRPHEDVVLMTKAMILQSWYGLADEQVERDCNDRLTFMNFLGYPSKVPDARTIWLCKERIAKESRAESQPQAPSTFQSSSTPRTSSPAGSSRRSRSPPRRPTTAPWTSQRRGRSASGIGATRSEAGAPASA
ncbi:MAG: transposase [Nitrososphaerota archaeon]|jgi:hypothetical protein|nr:transposase [Nitrososphaerota archaeon]